MKKILLTFLLFILCPLPLYALENLNIVTYADFHYIRDITSSINHVYFATTEGVIRYNKLEKKWEEPLTDDPSIEHRNIGLVYVDRFDKKLYGKTEDAKYEYDINFEKWYEIGEIPAIDQDYNFVKPPPIMYVPAGYNYSADGYFIDRFGRNYQISAMIDDLSSSTWIGTWGFGAAMTQASSNFVEFLPYGLIQNRVQTIFNDNGQLVISGDVYNSPRNGITLFDPDYNDFEYIESGVDFDLPAVNIQSIESDEKNYYIGTETGLRIIDKDSRKTIKYYTERTGLTDNNIIALHRIGDSLFVGGEFGLQMISLSTDSIKIIYPNQFLNSAIYDIASTDTTLWIASAQGAFQLNLKTDALQRFSDPTTTIFSSANGLAVSKRYIFISSNNGMVRLNLKTGQIDSFLSVRSGFRPRPVAAYDDVAFLGTDNGFIMYYLTKKGLDNEREFTEFDGLPSSYINVLLLDGDYLWIGSNKGLTKFLWNDPYRVD